MKQLLLLVAALVAAAPLADAGAAAAKLRVVTTIPDLADFVREVGGDRVEVRSIARGTENIHLVQVRPSDIVAVNKADLFVEMGLSLEHAYVPGLLMTARNKRIQPGKPGFLNVSEGWQPIEVPEEISRGRAADIHPLGNPHFNLHPEGGRHIAQRVYEGLVRVDPEGREHYRARHDAYVVRLDEAARRWQELAQEFQGQSLVTYHRDFSYFAGHYGMDVPYNIESRPGVPPTARDLATVIEGMKKAGVRVILTARWSNNRDVRFVAEKSGARIVEVPAMVGGAQGAGSWIGMMDYIHQALAEAYAGP